MDKLGIEEGDVMSQKGVRAIVRSHMAR